MLQLLCLNQFLHCFLNEMAEVRNLADASNSSIIQLQIIKDDNRKNSSENTALKNTAQEFGHLSRKPDLHSLLLSIWNKKQREKWFHFSTLTNL